MRQALADAGWREGGDEAARGVEGGAGGGESVADVVVVNTCTVTRRADQESRQLIRRIARERPSARIVVTGCYAQRAPDEVRGLPGVALVLGTAERETIAARMDALAGSGAACRVAVAPGRSRRRAPDASREASELTAAAPPAASLELGRARALLKIQDGCDAFCSYCIVPYVRGRSRSLAPQVILARARRLLSAGFREIVLTGADLGDYDAVPLARLVADLLALPTEGGGGAPPAAAAPRHRLRLSSIEPHKVDDSLVRLLATEPRLCRHLHLPLQSGSASVLRAMRRAYTPRDYARLVERVAADGPVAIGGDVIVGFPGEGAREFEETMAFVASLPIAYLHVFRYSERPETRSAASLAPTETPGVVRERAERLRALGEVKRRAFERSLVGTEREVLLEARRSPEGFTLGTSDLYASVALDGARPPHAGPFRVRITAYERGTLRGER